jgi:glycosyltransferase involved in cell wall biosynthesis
MLGDPAELQQESWGGAASVSIIPCRAPIYSLTEQLQLLRRTPPATQLFWSPHYNFPLGVKSKLLVTVHDVCHLALPELIHGPHRRAYARWMFRALRRRATAVLCVSDFTKREFLRLVDATGEAPVTVHNGVDDFWFRLERGPRPHPRPYLLFIGNMKPHKNVGTLVDAFRRIAPQVPQDLVLVGKHQGLLTADHAAMESAATLGGRVRFTGELPRAEVGRFLAHADVFVFPSLYEGFGFPPLEAMACGCPTVVSRAAALPEVCGDATLYLNPADPEDLSQALIRLLGDAGLRRDLTERGRRQAAGFSWERSAKETLAVMDAALTL